MAKKKIDFSGVETFARAPEGVHVAKIVTVEETVFQSGNEGFKVAFEILKGAGKGARVYENFPLADNSLWKLKTLLEAVKIKCDGRIILDTDKLIGKTLEIEVYHEEYDGKMRAKLGEMRKLAPVEAEDDEDFEEEDFDEEDDEEVEEKPAKKSKTASKPKKKEEAEEEDDEDEKPAKKTKKSSSTKAKPKKKSEPEDDDDWDDDDDDWEDD